MFCTECGKMLPEGSFVCPNCGTVVSVTGAAAEVTAPETAAAGTTAAEMPAAVETPAVPYPAVPDTTSGFGICTAGFVLSLIGFFVSIIGLLLVAGLILSGVGVSIASRDLTHNRAGRGLGIAGIVIAAVGILFRIFLFAALMAM